MKSACVAILLLLVATLVGRLQGNPCGCGCSCGRSHPAAELVAAAGSSGPVAVSECCCGEEFAATAELLPPVQGLHKAQRLSLARRQQSAPPTLLSAVAPQRRAHTTLGSSGGGGPPPPLTARLLPILYRGYLAPLRA